MKSILLILSLLSGFSSLLNAQMINSDSLLNEKIKQLKIENAELYSDNTELKKEKNEKLDEFTKVENKMLSVAAILWMETVFLFVFIIMYFSIRRKRRDDVIKLKKEIQKLKASLV